MERIYRTIKSVLDPFGYNSLEDKDAPTNFSSIDTMSNNTGIYLVSFPGAGWLIPPLFTELCAICF